MKKIAVPYPTGTVASLQQSVVALKTSHDITSGQVGDGLDSFVTWRDLINVWPLSLEDLKMYLRKANQ
jgi:hypothetical protein